MNSYKFKFTLTSVFIIFVLFSLVPAQGIAKMLSISRNNANMRTGPGKKYPVKWKLSKGYPLKLLKRKGNWYRVKDFENDIGWVYKTVTNDKRHMIVKVHRLKNKKINIRRGPGIKNSLVGQAYYGVVFKTLDTKKGWVKLQHATGVTGWVKRSLLWGW